MKRVLNWVGKSLLVLILVGVILFVGHFWLMWASYEMGSDKGNDAIAEENLYLK